MASSVFTAVVDEMTGATSSTPGLAGLVPAPAAGDQDKVLKGDGTWGEVQASGGTLRVVPFSIGVNSWTLSNNVYTATYQSQYVTVTSVEFVEYTNSFRDVVRGDLNWAKVTGGIEFTTDVLPAGTLQGEIRVIDNDDGAVAIITQQTALPTIRDVPFTVAVADWSLNNDGLYEAVFTTAYVTATSHDFVEFDESIENATDGIKVGKAESSGAVVGLKFTSRRVPAGAVSGTVTPLDNADGKVAVVLQDTVMAIANGGTGANTLAGAKENLGIVDIENYITMLSSRKYLYDSGVINAMKFRNATSYDSSHGESITFNSTNIRFQSSFVSGSHFACGFLWTYIDVTPLREIGCNVSNVTTGVRFGIFYDYDGAKAYTSVINAVDIASEGDIKIDVSNIGGVAFLGFAITAGSSNATFGVTINKIWVE